MPQVLQRAVIIKDTDGHIAGISPQGYVWVEIKAGTIEATVGDVSISGLEAFDTDHVLVGMTPVQLFTTPLTGGSAVNIKVKTTGQTEVVYIAPSSARLLAGKGYPLLDGDTVQLDLKATAEVWAMGSTADQDVYTMQLGG